MLLPMILFGTCFAAILLCAAWFSAVTWSLFYGVHSLYWILVPMLGCASFVPLMFIGFFHRSAVLNVLSVISSAALGFLNYALVAALACWLVFGAAKLTGRLPDMHMIAVALFGLAVLVTVGGIVNASILRTTRVTVQIPNLPKAWQGREIALVSDIHLGSIRSRAFASRVVKRLNKLHPYAVFISGDMFDGPEAEPDHVVQPWTDLKAPAGAYVVSGNHDEFHDRDRALAAMERAGLHVLRNELVCVDGVQIMGVYDSVTRDRRSYAEVLRRMNMSKSMPGILLAHQPDNLDIPEKAGVSLQLSGHTHGGQFWPWTMFVSKMYGSHAFGLSRAGNMQIYTSNGAGTWGPPMRLGTRSEVVILRLEGGKGEVVGR
jgi:uncharacterized protein